MPLHMRSLLDKEMGELRETIVEMSSRVDQAIDQAMQALAERDLAKAQQVVAGDAEINRLRYKVETDSMNILATQQPMAGDLRFVVGTIHIAVELERMGDHAAGIARLAERLGEEEPMDSLFKLPKMAKRARKMLKTSIDAYINRATSIAQTSAGKDNKLDKNYRDLFDVTVTVAAQHAHFRRATYLLWIGHNLERIGDRAVNIAERVIYVTTGEFVEFQPAFHFADAPGPKRRSTPAPTGEKAEAPAESVEKAEAPAESVEKGESEAT